MSKIIKVGDQIKYFGNQIAKIQAILITTTQLDIDCELGKQTYIEGQTNYLKAKGFNIEYFFSNVFDCIAIEITLDNGKTAFISENKIHFQVNDPTEYLIPNFEEKYESEYEIIPNYAAKIAVEKIPG